MLRVSLYQLSFLKVDPDRIGLAEESFERKLPEFLRQEVSVEELRELASTEGAPTRCRLPRFSTGVLPGSFVRGTG